jgi:hypothetical protein
MRFASGEFGRAHAAGTKHVDLLFKLKAEGLNGTALLFGFLQTAETSGAKYISDVSYSLQLVYRGAAVECTSKIVIADGTQPPPAPVAAPPPSDDEYTTTVAPWRPELADGDVIDRELHCKQAASSTPHKVATHDVEYNAEVKRNLDPLAWSSRQDPSAIESRTVESGAATFYEECNLEPAKRHVRRYMHFLAAKFAPPDLDRIGKRYSDHQLVELPPECHKIDHVAGAPLRQCISADVHYAGHVELTESRDLPDERLGNSKRRAAGFTP